MTDVPRSLRTWDEPRCPACDREITSILDFPFVRVVDVKTLPLPESVDEFAGPEAVNRTPDVNRLMESMALQEYLARLRGQVNKVVAPRTLEPDWPVDTLFLWARKEPTSRLYASLARPAVAGVTHLAEVTAWAEGPKLGSAGGPTLTRAGALAQLHFEGHMRAH